MSSLKRAGGLPLLRLFSRGRQYDIYFSLMFSPYDLLILHFIPVLYSTRSLTLVLCLMVLLGILLLLVIQRMVVLCSLAYSQIV